MVYWSSSRNDGSCYAFGFPTVIYNTFARRFCLCKSLVARTTADINDVSKIPKTSFLTLFSFLNFFRVAIDLATGVLCGVSEVLSIAGWFRLGMVSKAAWCLTAGFFQKGLFPSKGWDGGLAGWRKGVGCLLFPARTGIWSDLTVLFFYSGERAMVVVRDVLMKDTGIYEMGLGEWRLGDHQANESMLLLVGC